MIKINILIMMNLYFDIKNETSPNNKNIVLLIKYQNSEDEILVYYILNIKLLPNYM